MQALLPAESLTAEGGILVSSFQSLVSSTRMQALVPAESLAANGGIPVSGI